MRIPKIIHQTWKHNRIPKHFKLLADTWKQYHPEWEYKFWTDKSGKDFVQTNFPELFEIYNTFETNIQRADMIRYLVLYKMGGVYVDMDFECFENLEDLLKNDVCTFSNEPLDHCIMHRMDKVICNAFMASIPEHPFIKLLIKEACKPVEVIYDVNTMVMQSTGPFMVTRVYEQNKNELDLTILDPKHVYPLTRNEVISMLRDDHTDPAIQHKLDGSVAVHYWLNTWVV